MSLHQDYAAIRKRLRNPPNAVVDNGINLRRDEPAPVKTVQDFILESERRSREAEAARRFDAACLKFFVWQCMPCTKEERKFLRRLRKHPATLTCGFILRAVAENFAVSVEDLKGQSRRPIYARPRQIAYWLCRRLTNQSLSDIGKHLGGRDHSTILSGVEKIDEQRQIDRHLSSLIDELLAYLAPVDGPVVTEEKSKISDLDVSGRQQISSSVASALCSIPENSDADDQPPIPSQR